MEWYEDDSFWVDVAPVIFDERRWAEAEHVADDIVRLLALSSGMKVLDAGCGVGRISLPLAARGLCVVGVDVSPSLLEAARASARAWAEDRGVPPGPHADPELGSPAAAPFDADFVVADLRRFDRPAAFDAAVCLYTSFGYCEEKAGDLEVLRAIARSLVPGGGFCLELLGKEIVRENFVARESYESSGLRVESEYAVEGDFDGLLNTWTSHGPRGSRTRTWRQRLYSADELRAALEAAGFGEIEVAGGFEGEPYSGQARTLVAVARKG